LTTTKGLTLLTLVTIALIETRVPICVALTSRTETCFTVDRGLNDKKLQIKKALTIFWSKMEEMEAPCLAALHYFDLATFARFEGLFGVARREGEKTHHQEHYRSHALAKSQLQ
jgi:hypothetical protein